MSFAFHHPNYYKKQKEEAKKPLSEVQLQELKEQKRVGNHLKRVWGIAEKPPRKAIVQSTETKSETKAPELTGVDRYILAKK